MLEPVFRMRRGILEGMSQIKSGLAKKIEVNKTITRIVTLLLYKVFCICYGACEIRVYVLILIDNSSRLYLANVR